MTTGSPSANEGHLLLRSFVATAFIAAIGIGFGIIAGSFAILFDGLYSLIDSAMAGLSFVVARLILADMQPDAAFPPPETGLRRIQFGYWHLEPLVIFLNAALIIAATLFAIVNAFTVIREGGSDLSFGPALIYAAFVAAICFAMAWSQTRASRRMESGLIRLDAKAWIISGSITSALFLGFLLGWLAGGTRFAPIQPYIDPGILIITCLIVIPLPISDLRTAFEDILRAAPPELDARVRAAAQAAATRHRFTHTQTYAARVGRSDLIEINFIVPADWPAVRVADLDAIRLEVSDAVGDDGPDRWMTVTFTADPRWAVR